MTESGQQDLEILDEVVVRVERLERQAARIKEELADAVKEVELRTQLIALNAPVLLQRVPERFRPSDSGAASAPRPSKPVRDPRSQAKTPVVSHREMVDWCRTMLREEGSELHISEIRKRLENNPEWRVPGKGNDSNVSVHLARSDEFEGGSGRGMWRLVEKSGT